MRQTWRVRSQSRQKPKRHCQHQGFSLLEVLIAIVVLAIGLLGVASLQMNSMGFTHSAYLRSQATLQVQNMADRMRSNLEGVKAGHYNNVDTTFSSSANPSCFTASVGCTPQEMAAFDEFEWQTANQALLPQGSGSVSGEGEGSIFTITVSWSEMTDLQSLAKSGAASTTGSVQSQIRL